MSMFMTSEQIEHLTGRKQRKAQCRWMDENGIRWKLNAAGELRVSCRHVDEVFCGVAPAQAERKRPNLEALHR